MRKAAIFASLFLLAGLTAAHADPCRLVRYAQIPIADRAHAVMIPVSVNGTKTEFLVDTGSMLSGLSGALVAAQKLPVLKEEAGLYSADGKRTPDFVDVAELDIGKMPAKNAYLFVMPPDKKIGSDQLGGLLGANVLQHFDLDFDFGGRTFNLFGPNDCGAHVVYWSSRAGGVPFVSFNGHHIQVDVTLDGQPLRAIIDTGASLTSISAGEAERRFDLNPGGQGTDRIAGMPQDFLIQYAHRFKTLTLGDVTVDAPVVGLQPDDMNRTMRNDLQRHTNILQGDLVTPEMTIGLDVLSKLHFYISYGQKMIYVTPANVGHPAAADGTATVSSARWASGG